MKVTVTLTLETAGGESEADFVDDEAWLDLINDYSPWSVDSVASSAKAINMGHMR